MHLLDLYHLLLERKDNMNALDWKIDCHAILALFILYYNRNVRLIGVPLKILSTFSFLQNNF